MYKEIAELPKRIMVEVSNICNHKCIFCSNSKAQRKKQVINNEIAEKAIREGYVLGAREISFHGMGEPLVCKELINYIKLAKEEGYSYIYIDTNGALAIPETINPIIDAGIDSIKFSISAGNKDTFKKVQGKDDYELVLQNLKGIDEYRKKNNKKIKIIVDFVETNFNKGEFEILKMQIADYVDQVWFSPCGNQAGNMPEDEIKSIYEDYSNSYGYDKELLCKEPFDRIVITSGGLITSCCMDNDNNLVYGDLSKTSLLDAWNSDKICDLRRQHLTGEKVNYYCKYCSLTKFYQLHSSKE